MTAKALHECTVCHRVDHWSDSWQWYGSYAVLDAAPDRIIKTCGDRCRVEVDTNPRRYRIPKVRLHSMNYRVKTSPKKRKKPKVEQIWDVLTTGDAI